MKRQKKAFALLAAILMMASLLSIGVGAEGTAEKEENLRNITYVAAASTYIYASQGGNGAATSVAKRARVSSSRSMTSWASIVVASGDHWPDASRGGVSGYMWDRKICPKTNCYKINGTNVKLYKSIAADGTPGIEIGTYSSGTILYHIQFNNPATLAYRKVIVLAGGAPVTGWILTNATAKEDGYA